MTIIMTKMLKLGHKLVLLICMTGYCYGALELVFDTENSPPATIQADPALRVWSMAVNHIMGKPILAQLYNDGVPVTDYSGTCNISSIDTASYNSGDATSDSWANSGGTLCQYVNRLPYPSSMDPLYEFICSTTTTLEDVPFYNGEVRADGLYHNFTSPPAASDTRVIVFSLIYNGTLVTNATNPIEVTDAAVGLRFTSALPATSVANKNLNVEVEIFSSSGSRLVKGSDSALRITLQVAWLKDLTIMHDSSAFLDMVYYENVRLTGTNVVQSKSTYNTLVTKRATAGVAFFPGLRILDVHSCVKLNVTATMPDFPHFRMPPTMNEQRVIYELPNGLPGYYINDTSVGNDPAVLIGNCINIKQQTAKKLVLKNSADIKTPIGANSPIQSNPVIEIQDATGDRVYSGSDANLVLMSDPDPSTKKAAAAARSRKYRERKKNDEEYKQRERDRRKLQRLNAKESENIQEKERQREMNRRRQARYRERKRQQAQTDESNYNENYPAPKKRMTRAEHEKKKQYWKERKRLQRANMSSQKKRRIREYDRRRKQKKSDQSKHLDMSTLSDIDTHSNSQLSDNAVRQRVFRTNKLLPKSPEKFAQVVGHIMRNASPRKKASLKGMGISGSPNLDIKQKSDYFASIRNTVSTLKSKTQSSNMVKRCLAMSFKCLKKARSYKKLSKETGLSYNFIRKYARTSLDEKSNAMQRKKRRDALDDSELQKDICQHYLSKSSFVPDMKSVSSKTLEPKKILMEPISNVYEEFKQQNPNTKISKSKFHQLRPKNVQTTQKQKLYQSKCEYCTNPQLKIKALNKLCDEKGTPQCKIKDKGNLMDITLCEKGENTFHAKKCLMRDCSLCGVANLMNYLEDVVRSAGDELVSWQKWKNKKYDRPGKAPSTRKVLETKTGTIFNLIEDLEKDVKDLPHHIFVANWQKASFNTLSKNPPKKSVVMHLDFSENYSTFYQEEVSSAHWVKNLVTVHPIVAFYDCPVCEQPTKPVMDVLVFLSDDNRHDHHAVQNFMTTSVKFLKEQRNVEFTKIHEFTDGCASQYKSRGPMVDLSYGCEDFDVIRERNYFGSCHGKGPSDGAGAVTKTAARRSVIRDQAVITDAKSMYTYLNNKFTRAAKIGNTCNHSRRQYFLVENINRERPERQITTTLKGTRRLQAIQGVSSGKINTRNLTCTCIGCMGDGASPCTNRDFVGPWTMQYLELRDVNEEVEQAEAGARGRRVRRGVRRAGGATGHERTGGAARSGNRGRRLRTRGRGVRTRGGRTIGQMVETNDEHDEAEESVSEDEDASVTRGNRGRRLRTRGRGVRTRGGRTIGQMVETNDEHDEAEESVSEDEDASVTRGNRGRRLRTRGRGVRTRGGRTKGQMVETNDEHDEAEESVSEDEDASVTRGNRGRRLRTRGRGVRTRGGRTIGQMVETNDEHDEAEESVSEDEDASVTRGNRGRRLRTRGRGVRTRGGRTIGQMVETNDEHDEAEESVSEDEDASDTRGNRGRRLRTRGRGVRTRGGRTKGQMVETNDEHDEAEESVSEDEDASDTRGNRGRRLRTRGGRTKGQMVETNDEHDDALPFLYDKDMKNQPEEMSSCLHPVGDFIGSSDQEEDGDFLEISGLSGVLDFLEKESNESESGLSPVLMMLDFPEHKTLNTTDYEPMDITDYEKMDDTDHLAMDSADHETDHLALDSTDHEADHSALDFDTHALVIMETDVDTLSSTVQESDVDNPPFIVKASVVQESDVDTPPSIVQESDVDTLSSTVQESDVQESDIDNPPSVVQASVVHESDINTLPSVIQESDVDTPPSTVQESDVDTPPSTVQESDVDTPPSTVQESDVDTPPSTVQESDVDNPPSIVQEPDVGTLQPIVQISDVDAPLSVDLKHTVNDQELEGEYPVIPKPDVSRRYNTGSYVAIFHGNTIIPAVTIAVSTNVAACLSTDSVTQKATFGELTYVGSICDPIGAVALVFSATSAVSSSILTTAQTPTIQVTDKIYIASFANTYSSASSSDVGPFVDAFSQYAVEDTNAGYFDGILTSRQLIMNSYNTWNDISRTAQQLLDMVEDGKANPERKVQGIIGFGSNRLTEAMSTIMNTNEIPAIATVEDEYNFGDKTNYPYFNRVGWDFGGLSRATMVLCKERHWTKMVFMRQADYDIHSILYEKAIQFDIKIDQEISFPLLDPSVWHEGAFDEQFEKLQKSGTRIVFLFAYAPLSYFIASEAIRHNMAGINGYQWIFLNEFGWQFPWANQGGVCTSGPVVCTVGFTGLAGIGLMYDITGTSTEEWEHVMTTHTRSYRLNYRGSTPRRSLNEVTAQWGLGYDAARVYAYALNHLVSNNLTITAHTLTNAIRNVQFNGLTGDIKFTTTGNRPGFHGFWVTSNPHPPDATATPPTTVVFARDIIMENELSTTVKEIPQQARRPMDSAPWNHIIGAYAMPNTTFVNKRRFNSSTGMISSSTQQLIPRPPSTDPPVDIVMIETTPAPFYCSQGCGGSALDEYDISKYEFGNCTNMEKCTCNYGYIGSYCQTMSCSCKNGYCEVPFKCICDSGWIGSHCDIPVCSTVNCGSHGNCTGPEKCTCDSGYTGKECNMVLIVVVILPLLAGIIVAVGAVFFIRWLLKRQHLIAALKNLDWMVKWDEVMIGDARAMSFLSTAGDEFTRSNKANIATWRSQKCFIQTFNCDTLNVENENLRYEIVRMKELHHNNIITFVGACLDYPHVSVLTEVAPKGSLEDLLSNESVKLGWDFRFSILKDICRGMEFLHRSEIGSHGRLKSTNCIVDNRWTCKITGFGLPTLRYDGTRKIRPNYDDIPKTSELLWTAPEILKSGVQRLDDVRFGTKAGDVYSFGIILSEVCTREEPFSNETSFITVPGILELIKDKGAPEAAEAKRLWYKNGGDTARDFRPKVEDDCLPEEYAAKTGFRKLMESAWSSNPDIRPTFRQMLDKLNEIYPIKGELIDNLVNMLEKYSSNLEAIVAERTKDLIAEKAKTEQLLSQMLPKKVMEDLKHGKQVEPESFECVTIFFSDIVGFTKIAGGSTPLQIVDLLNDLYTTFDAILDNYDVYKVETIGDAYVVVSGLPIRNGDLHAGEIATMSLDLMASLMEFKIRHMPGETLQLRIGMHSGPCVAGVVGLKMPRYCLFGDTVNTASRMESNSMALRIHMSSYTRDILVKLGGYHLDCRGEIEAKGKGKMTTYWLNGKDGFDKKLPGKDMAASLSQHEFK